MHPSSNFIYEKKSGWMKRIIYFLPQKERKKKMAQSSPRQSGGMEAVAEEKAKLERMSAALALILFLCCVESLSFQYVMP